MELIRIPDLRSQDDIRELCKRMYILKPEEYVISTFDDHSIVSFKVKDRTEPSKVIITVSGGAYEAFLNLFPPLNNGRVFTLDEVMAQIAEEGVALNLEANAIAAAHERYLEGEVIEELLISKGVAPIRGRDAEVTIYFDKKDKRPQIVDGKVDYKNVSTIQVVNKGDILITKKLATAGTKGINVKRDDVPAIPGKDVVIMLGDGATVNDTGTTYTATADGYVEYGNNRLAVHPIYIVNGDVDYSTGNIKFNGAVHVKGEVLSGFKIEASKSILVDGVCQDCELISKGNIILRTGMKSKGQGLVMAEGTAVIGYIENAKVYAKEHIEIKKYSYNSELYAGGRIDATSGDGVIAGGIVQAYNEIAVKQLGTLGNVAFTTYIGNRYYIEQEIAKLDTEILRATDVKENLEGTLSGFDLTRPKILAHPKIEKLLAAQNEIIEVLEIMRTKREELVDEMRARQPKIKVKNKMFDGITIKFFNVSIVMKEELDNVVFYYDDKYQEVAWVSMKNAASIE